MTPKLSEATVLATLIVVCWFPTILQATPSCVSGPSNLAIRSQNHGRDTNGILQVKYAIDSSVSGDLAEVISAAIDDLNANSSTTKVHFTTDGAGAADYTFNVDNSMSASNVDPCAATYPYTNYGYTSFSSYMASAAGSAVVEMDDGESGDFTLLTDLAEHEIFHYLGVDDVNGQDSSTIMTNYTGLTNDCLYEAGNAGYPSAGPSATDFARATSCANGTSSNDEDVANGTSDQDSWYQEQYQGDCHWVLEDPIYATYTDFDGDFFDEIVGYDWLDIEGGCGGPPPY